MIKKEIIEKKLEVIEKRYDKKINYSLFKINDVTQKDSEGSVTNFKYFTSHGHSTNYIIVKPLYKPIHIPYINEDDDTDE